jgi:hypothetical protein
LIVFVTSRGYEMTVWSLVQRRWDFPIPPVETWSYDTLFRATTVPKATFICTDIERLYPWEANLAGSVFKAMRAAGIRCLNDPARIFCRYQLLRALHDAGINPFDIYRADDDPKPRRFPVFLRAEQEHGYPLGGLLASQAALDAQLAKLADEGISLRGLVVIEFCGEPIAPGIWRKFGTFRIGDRFQVGQHVTEDKWMVKNGTKGLCPEWLYLVENDTVVQNRCPDAVIKAFRIANIEYGRADHGLFGGQDVVYEINTNPSLGSPRRQRSPTRDRTLAHSRAQLAAALTAIDSGDGSPVLIGASPHLMNFRKMAGSDLAQWRP